MNDAQNSLSITPDDGRFPRLRHILISSAWLGLGEGFTRLANFLVVVLVANTRGPEGLGVFAIGQLLGNYLLLGTDFGLKTIGARLISLHRPWTSAIVQTVQRRRALLGATLFPIGLLYAFLGPIPDEARLFVAGFALSVLPQAFTLDWTLLGLERYALLGVLRAGVALVFAAASTILLLTGGALGTVALANGGATMAGAIAIWFIWFRRSEHRTVATLSAPEADHLVRETRWSNVAWLGLATIFVQMFQTVDTLMLGAMVPVDEVGRYNGAHKLVVLIFGVYYLFTQAMLPKLAKMGATASPQVLRWTALLAGLGTACGLIVAVMADPIVATVYGSSMTGAAPLLRLLALTVPLEFALAFMGTALVAWGRERLVLALSGTGLALNVLLNLTVIPTFGIIGAAQVKIATYVVVVALLAVATRGTKLAQRLSEFLDRWNSG